MSKSTELKLHMRLGHNIAATHSLFYLMDAEALELVRQKHYSLIVDESIQVIERLNITNKDFDLIINQLATNTMTVASSGWTIAIPVVSTTTRKWRTPAPCSDWTLLFSTS